MNIDKYIDNQTQTDNGCVYKDYEIFESNPSAICYIPEYGLSDLQKCRENGEDLTDSEIIERGIGDTRETITNAVLEFLNVMDIDTNKEELESKGVIDFVFGELDWCCLGTFLDTSSIDEIFFEEEE